MLRGWWNAQQAEEQLRLILYCIEIHHERRMSFPHGVQVDWIGVPVRDYTSITGCIDPGTADQGVHGGSHRSDKTVVVVARNINIPDFFVAN